MIPSRGYSYQLVSRDSCELVLRTLKTFHYTSFAVIASDHIFSDPPYDWTHLDCNFCLAPPGFLDVLVVDLVEELVAEHVEELVVTLTNNFLQHAVHSYDAPQQWIVLLKDFLVNEVAVTIFSNF